MPTKGDFQIELIDAHTKAPFQEHLASTNVTPNDVDIDIDIDAYVEVEPNLEYYIKVTNHSISSKAIFKYKVDGQDLGYYTTLEAGQVANDGIYTYSHQKFRSQVRALKFQKRFDFGQNAGSTSINTSTTKKALNKNTASSSPTSSKNSTLNNPYMINSNSKRTYHEQNSNHDSNKNQGMIQITIYEHIPIEGYYYASDFSKFKISTLNKRRRTESYSLPEKNDTNNNITHSMKNIYSQEGDLVQEINVDNGKRPITKFGKILQSFKIKYCSTVGLIEHGILPKPDSVWDWYRMIKSYHGDDSCNGDVSSDTGGSNSDEDVGSSDNSVVIKPPVTPEMVKNETKDHNGCILACKEYELFDLTEDV